MSEETVAREKSLQLDVDAADMADLLAEFSADVTTCNNKRSRASWKWDEAYQLEHGLIGKPDPNMPFKGSSDIRFRPCAEDKRKIMPLYINSVMMAPHTARFISASDSSSAQELYTDYVYRCQMLHFRLDVTTTADSVLGKGLGIVKLVWDYERETCTKVIEIDANTRALLQNNPTDDAIRRFASDAFGWDLTDPIYKKRADDVIAQIKDKDWDGKFVEVIADVTVYDGLRVLPILDNNSLTYETGGTRSIQDSEWVNEEILISERRLLAKSEKYGGSFKNVEALLDEIRGIIRRGQDVKTITTRGPESERYQSVVDIVQGINSQGELIGYLRIFERHCYVPRRIINKFRGRVTGTDDFVKAIVTYCPDVDPHKVGPLRIIEYPYDFEGKFRWCYWDWRFNETGKGILCGEGIMELGAPYQIEENISRNAALDRSTLALSPRRFVRRNAGIISGTHRQVGQYIEVNGDPTNVSHVETWPDLKHLANEDAELMRRYRQEIVGVNDVRNMGNYDRPPTAAQVNAQREPIMGIMQFEIGNWLEGWGKVYEMGHLIAKSMLFFGKDKKEFNFDSVEGGKSVTITAKDFVPHFIIFAGGDINRMNPMLEAQQMQAWYSSVRGDPMAVAAIKPYEALKTYTVDFIGAIRAAKVLETPQDAEKWKQQYLQMLAQATAIAQVNKQPRGRGGQNGGGQGGGNGPRQLGNGQAVQGPNTGAYAGAGR